MLSARVSYERRSSHPSESPRDVPPRPAASPSPLLPTSQQSRLFSFVCRNGISERNTPLLLASDMEELIKRQAIAQLRSAAPTLLCCIVYKSIRSSGGGESEKDAGAVSNRPSNPESKGGARRGC